MNLLAKTLSDILPFLLMISILIVGFSNVLFILNIMDESLSDEEQLQSWQRRAAARFNSPKGLQRTTNEEGDQFSGLLAAPTFSTLSSIDRSTCAWFCQCNDVSWPFLYLVRPLCINTFGAQSPRMCETLFVTHGLGLLTVIVQ